MEGLIIYRPNQNLFYGNIQTYSKNAISCKIKFEQATFVDLVEQGQTIY